MLLLLAKAAKIIRNYILNHDSFKFTGTFPRECQEKSILSSLKYLVAMITKGPNLKEPEKRDSNSGLSLNDSLRVPGAPKNSNQAHPSDTLRALLGTCFKVLQTGLKKALDA